MKGLYVLYVCIFQISETRRNDGRGRNHDCDYLITIKTSCDSPTYTKDKIGLSFGDAYGDEVLFFLFFFMMHCNNIKLDLWIYIVDDPNR
jgi:hypothetical protein